MKKLPKAFFEKKRPKIQNESKQEDYRIDWENQVLTGEKKITFKLPPKTL